MLHSEVFQVKRDNVASEQVCEDATDETPEEKVSHSIRRASTNRNNRAAEFFLAIERQARKQAIF